MIFRYPYPLTYDPPIAQTGNPLTINRGRNDLGSRDFFLQSNSSNPSSALIMTSFGMDAGIPRDEVTNRRYTREGGRLWIAPIVTYRTFFYSGGVFASALTSSFVRFYVEEYDPSGNFVRGINGSNHTILMQNPWWFRGSEIWSPYTTGETITTELAPVDRRINVHPNYFYRVYIDLIGEIRAAGYGGLGGSASIAQVFLRVSEVDVSFSPP